VPKVYYEEKELYGFDYGKITQILHTVILEAPEDRHRQPDILESGYFSKD
jgi:hypothetical protein